MEETINQKASFVVSEIILDQKGKFTLKDIIDKVIDMICDQFGSMDQLKQYISEKLNSMCEYGLVGRTDAYYFSI